MSYRTDVDARYLERGQVRVDAARIGAVVLPTPLSLSIAAASILATLPGITMAIWALIGDGPPKDQDVVAAAGLLMCIALPPVLVFLLPALIMAGSNGARAAYCAIGGALSAAMGATLAAANLLQGEDASAGLFLGFLAAAPWGAVGALAAIVAWLQFHRSLVRDRKRRTLTLLERYGSLTEDELHLGVGGSQGQLWLSLRELHTTTPLRHEHGRIWTARRLAARQALLLATVEAGERSLAALTKEVGEPMDVVRRWLEELREAGALQWTADGDLLVVGGQRAQHPCEGCGGPMKVVGRQMLRCVHCGNEAVDAA